MAYNHALAEAEWKREKDKREAEMRQSCMGKEDIQSMIAYDRSVFNSNRRFECRLNDSVMDIENLVVKISARSIPWSSCSMKFRISHFTEFW